MFSVKECNATQDLSIIRDVIYRMGMQVIIGETHPDVVVSALYEIIVSILIVYFVTLFKHVFFFRNIIILLLMC